jgi:hypothetical protein
MALALLAGGSAAVLRWLGFLDWHRLRELLDARRRNLARRSQLDQIASHLESANEPAAVWQSLLGAAPALDVDHVALRAAGRTWNIAGAGALAADMHIARFSLRPERPGIDVLELGWTDGRSEVDRDTEIAIEQLCGYVRNALARCDGSGTNEIAEGADFDSLNPSERASTGSARTGYKAAS